MVRLLGLVCLLAYLYIRYIHLSDKKGFSSAAMKALSLFHTSIPRSSHLVISTTVRSSLALSNRSSVSVPSMSTTKRGLKKGSFSLFKQREREGSFPSLLSPFRHNHQLHLLCSKYVRSTGTYWVIKIWAGNTYCEILIWLITL